MNSGWQGQGNTSLDMITASQKPCIDMRCHVLACYTCFISSSVRLAGETGVDRRNLARGQMACLFQP